VICKVCREYQAGERKDRFFGGVRLHTCENIPQGWMPLGCPCGCVVLTAPEPDYKLLDRAIGLADDLFRRGRWSAAQEIRDLLEELRGQLESGAVEGGASADDSQSQDEECTPIVLWDRSQDVPPGRQAYGQDQGYRNPGERGS
jgi:hypothetical protein